MQVTDEMVNGVLSNDLAMAPDRLWLCGCPVCGYDGKWATLPIEEKRQIVRDMLEEAFAAIA